MKRTSRIMGLTVAVFALTISAAQAAVTFNSETGTGFVGKGDVQTVLGYNNSQLQRNASSLVFTSSQPASQALSQAATQAGTQSGAVNVTRTVSCVIEQKKKTFTNEGSRPGSRDAARTGSRTGSRTGTVDGKVSYTVAYDARVKTQITGFTLKGFQTQPTFSASGVAAWDEPVFEDWAFGDWSYGDIEWGGWQATEPGTNPADCLGNNPGVSDLEDATVEGDLVEGDITAGVVEYGAEVAGAVTTTGAAQLFVNGKALN